MLTPENFKCDRKCGKCCIETVVLLSESDINQIKTLGYEKSFFLDYERLGPYRGKPSLKKNRKNGWCVFLDRNKDGVFSCRIYGSRPDICRKYPFFGEKIESCLREKGFVQLRRKDI